MIIYACSIHRRREKLFLSTHFLSSIRHSVGGCATGTDQCEIWWNRSFRTLSKAQIILSRNIFRYCIMLYVVKYIYVYIYKRKLPRENYVSLEAVGTNFNIIYICLYRSAHKLISGFSIVDISNNLIWRNFWWSRLFYSSSIINKIFRYMRTLNFWNFQPRASCLYCSQRKDISFIGKNHHPSLARYDTRVL